jgi:uroporphyrinogen III methyltransferase/synthase
MPFIHKPVISTQLPDQFKKLRDFMPPEIQMLNFPMIEIENIALNPVLKEKIENISAFGWLIFTSMRGVRAFLDLFNSSGISTKNVEFPKIATIGHATNSELNKYRLVSDYINPSNTAKEFSVHLLNGVLKSSDRVLLVLGDRSDDQLQNELATYCQTERINVYKTNDIECVEPELFQLVNSDQYSWLVFTSPSAFQNFIRLGIYHADEHNFRIASIGQRTTSEIEKLGFKVQLTSEKSGLINLADLISNQIKNGNFHHKH